ncbi:MAG: hypothetical protein WC222_07740 [Parachlamydiales bacterium]|jgi:hypothetical protein
MSFPARMDAPGKRALDCVTSPPYHSPVKLPRKIIPCPSGKENCPPSPEKSNVLSIAQTALNYSTPLPVKNIKKLSPQTICDQTVWKAYFEKEGIDADSDRIEECVTKFSKLASTYPFNFESFFSSLLKKSSLMELSLKIDLSTESFFIKFEEIIHHPKITEEEILLLSDLLNFYPIHTRIVLSAFINGLNTDNYFVCELLTEVQYNPPFFIDILNDISDKDYAFDVLKLIHAWRESDLLPPLLQILHSALKNFNENILQNINAIGIQAPQLIFDIARLVHLHRETLRLLSNLELLGVPCPNFELDKLSKVLERITPPDFPIYRLFSLSFVNIQHELIIDLLIHHPDELFEILQLNDSGQVTNNYVSSIMQSIQGIEHEELLEELIENVKGIPLNIRMKLLALAGHGNVQYAGIILANWLDKPHMRSFLNGILKVAVENGDSVLAKHLSNTQILGLTDVFKLFAYLLENEFEDVIYAYCHCETKPDLQVLTQASLKHFTVHGKLGVQFRSLLISAQEDSEWTKQFLILLNNETDAWKTSQDKSESFPMLAAKQVMAFDGDLKAAELLLHLPENVFNLPIASIFDIKLIARVWQNGSFDPSQLAKFESTILAHLQITKNLTADTIVSNILTASRKFNLSFISYSNLENYKIAFNDLISRTIAVTCVLDSGLIHLQLLNEIAASPLLKNFTDELNSHLIKRVRALNANPTLKLKFESLQFDGDQNGPIALLVRATLGLKRGAAISHADLIRTAFFAYLHMPATLQDRCSGVSALELFFTTDPTLILNWLKEFTAKNKLELTFDNIDVSILPNLVPDISFLNSPLTVFRNHPDFVGLLPLANYFNVAPEDVSHWYEAAFDHIAEMNLQSKKVSLDTTTKKLFDALLKTLHSFTAIPLQGQEETHYEAVLVVAALFEPLPCRMLQAAILSSDVCRLTKFRDQTRKSFNEFVNMHFKQMSDNLQNNLENLFETNLNESSTVYFSTSINETKVFRNAIVDPRNFDFKDAHPILSENNYNKYFIELVEATLTQFIQDSAPAGLPPDNKNSVDELLDQVHKNSLMKIISLSALTTIVKLFNIH